MRKVWATTLEDTFVLKEEENDEGDGDCGEDVEDGDEKEKKRL